MDAEARIVQACNMVEDLEKNGEDKRDIIKVVSKLWCVTISSIREELRMRFIYPGGKDE